MKITKVIKEAKQLCEKYGLKPISIYIQVHSHFDEGVKNPITTGMTVFYKKENEVTNFSVSVYGNNSATKEQIFIELEIMLMSKMPIPKELQTEIEY